MSSNTKIVVLRLRAIIYTVIFIILGVALIFLLIFMFGNKKMTPNPADFILHTRRLPPHPLSSMITLWILQVVVDEECT